MANKFFEKNKKKGLAGLLLLLLGGNAKYAVVLVLAGLASAPLVVSSDAFKSFKNSPSVVAVMRALGVGGGYSIADKDLIAQAAHNSEGKKSSYWQKYFEAVNAPLPLSKFTSMNYLKGGLEEVGPVSIKDEDSKDAKTKKDKNGVKGVVNEEESKHYNGDVDLSEIINKGVAAHTDEDSMYDGIQGEGLDLGANSAYAPYLSKSIILSNGGAQDRKSALEDKVKRDAGARVPAVSYPRTSGKTGRVSSFAWSKMSRGTMRSKAFRGFGSGSSPRTQMSDAYAMSVLASEEATSNEYADNFAAAPFDGTDTAADHLLTGEPVGIPNTGGYVANATGVGTAVEQAIACGNAMTEAGEETKEDLEEMRNVLKDMKKKPACTIKNKVNGKVKRWNNKLDKVTSLCNGINETYDKANLEGCNGEANPANFECSNYADNKVKCSGWQAFVGSFMIGLMIFTGLGITLVVGALIGGWGWDVFRKIVDWSTGNDSSVPPTDVKDEGEAGIGESVNTGSRSTVSTRGSAGESTGGSTRGSASESNDENTSGKNRGSTRGDTRGKR